MQQHLDAALKIGERGGRAATGDHDVYAMLVDAAAQQRDPLKLRQYAPLAEETATRVGHQLYAGIAHRAWGVAHALADEYPQAEARFQKAFEIFAGYPAPWQMGRTLFEMGELARLQGRTEQAREQFSRALSAFEQLHAVPYANQARAALERLGQV